MLWSSNAKLANAITIMASFHLWISKGGVDTFVFVINYLTKAWEPMHVIIRLLKVNETIAIIVREIQFDSSSSYFCKNDCNNLASMATTLLALVRCFGYCY